MEMEDRAREVGREMAALYKVRTNWAMPETTANVGQLVTIKKTGD